MLHSDGQRLVNAADKQGYMRVEMGCYAIIADYLLLLPL